MKITKIGYYNLVIYLFYAKSLLYKNKESLLSDPFQMIFKHFKLLSSFLIGKKIRYSYI